MCFQGQFASGDGLSLYPRGSADNNTRFTSRQRARSRDLLADTLVALQTYVCVWSGKTHLTLSHLVGPDRLVYVPICQHLICLLSVNRECAVCLSALTYHYETQCIPTPLAWFAHQLPVWWQKLSVVGTFVIEIAVPLLFFSPLRRLRIGAFYLQVCTFY